MKIIYSLYGTLVLICFTIGFTLTDSWPLSIMLLIVGIIEWSFFEYIAHKFLHTDHSHNLGGPQHTNHHQKPSEEYSIQTSLGITSTIFVVMLTLHLILLGLHGLVLQAGFTLGYIIYEKIHYLCHTSPRFVKSWSRHHAYHHFKDQTKAYGVTTHLWDWVFRTLPSKK